MKIEIVKIPASVADIGNEITRQIVGIVLQRNVDLDEKTQDATVSVMEITTRLSEKHLIQARDAFAGLGLKKSTLILRPDEYRIM